MLWGPLVLLPEPFGYTPAPMQQAWRFFRAGLMEEEATVQTLLEQVNVLRRNIEHAELHSTAAMETFRVRYLGQRNGLITHLFKQLPRLPRHERRRAGIALNGLRKQAQERLDRTRTEKHHGASPKERPIDLTLPGRRQREAGSIHPLTHALRTISGIFERIGFSIAEGPEIEDDWHNFTALNFGVDHPARDMQDTLFLQESHDGEEGVMLRTHTSPVQIRSMLADKPPFRLIAPGRVYRNETITYKSYCLFHQVEGLVVDEGVTMADLKHVLYTFAHAFFGSSVKLRFRPSFFPFTEPSAELDVWWDSPGGGRWMEILGSGMVHPNVLEAVGLDSERYTGYAFGMGVERPAMLLYDIEDIRILYQNDIRFLSQF